MLVQPAIDGRRVDLARPGWCCSTSAMPSGAATMQIMRACRARPRCGGGRARPRRSRRWPASGRSSGRTLPTDLPAASSSTCDAIAVASSRCRPMWPTRALGMSSRMASSMPSPARSTGTTTTPPLTRRAFGRTERRLRPSRCCVGMSRVASAASSRLMRTAIRRNSSGGVRAVAERGESVVHERMLDDVNWHRLTISGATRRGKGAVQSGDRIAAPMFWRIASLAGRRRPPCSGASRPRVRPSASSSPTASSSRWTARRRVLIPGAVAIDGRDIVGVDTPEAIAARFAGAGDDRRVRAGGHAGAGQHPHARADGAVSRPGRRPGADGLAPEVHLPGRGQDRLAGVRAGRHAAGRARDDRVRARRPTRTCTTSRRRSRGSRTQAGLRGVLGQTIIQFPVPDAKTPAEGLARTEAFIKEFASDDLITPAVAPHAMYTLDTGDAEGGAGAGGPRARAGRSSTWRRRRTRSRPREQKYKTTPTAFLESIGFWGPRTIAAHGVWVTPADIGDPGAAPRRRVAQPREQHEARQRHRAGHRDARGRRRRRPRHRRRREQQRPRHVRGDAAGGVPAQAGRRAIRARSRRATALGMATIDGARVLGHGRSRSARSSPGKRADLIVVSMAAARQTPMYDPLSHLVYVTRGDDVRTTIVNGKVLMRDRTGADAGRERRAGRGADLGGEGPRRGRPIALNDDDPNRIPS